MLSPKMISYLSLGQPKKRTTYPTTTPPTTFDTSSTENSISISSLPDKEMTNGTQATRVSTEKNTDQTKASASPSNSINDTVVQSRKDNLDEQLISNLIKDSHFEEMDCRDSNVCKGLPFKHLLCLLPNVHKICPKSCDKC